MMRVDGRDTHRELSDTAQPDRAWPGPVVNVANEAGNTSRIGARMFVNPHMEGNEVLLGTSFLRSRELVQHDGSPTLC